VLDDENTGSFVLPEWPDRIVSGGGNGVSCWKHFASLRRFFTGRNTTILAPLSGIPKLKQRHNLFEIHLQTKDYRPLIQPWGWAGQLWNRIFIY
jgi:hypothetical protein